MREYEWENGKQKKNYFHQKQNLWLINQRKKESLSGRASDTTAMECSIKGRKAQCFTFLVSFSCLLFVRMKLFISHLFIYISSNRISCCGFMIDFMTFCVSCDVDCHLIHEFYFDIYNTTTQWWSIFETRKKMKFSTLTKWEWFFTSEIIPECLESGDGFS